VVRQRNNPSESAQDLHVYVSASIRPDPVPGAVLELPLLSEVLNVELPELNESAQMLSKRETRKTQDALVRLSHERSRRHILNLLFRQDPSFPAICCAS
jgi:hypothetical protein